MLEMSKLYSPVQDKLTSNSHTHSPTETVGRGENNIKQDISDTVQTVHTVQNVSLPIVRIEQWQAQENNSTGFDLCSRK